MNLLNNAVMNVLTPSFQLIIRKTRSTGRPQLCREANALSVVIQPRCDFCVRPDLIFLAGLVVKREAQTELEIGNLLRDDFLLCFDIDHLTRCAKSIVALGSCLDHVCCDERFTSIRKIADVWQRRSQYVVGYLAPPARTPRLRRCPTPLDNAQH